MLNLKAGDLAMVVRDSLADQCGGPTCTAGFIGTPIEVVELVFDLELFSLGWTYKGPNLTCKNCGRFTFAFLEADLQPLRPPPESVRDVINELAPKQQVENAR